MINEENLQKIKSAVSERMAQFDGVDFYLELIKSCASNSSFNTETPETVAENIVNQADEIMLELLKENKNDGVS